ncbi:hypothetical protein H9L10_01445 [Phycicoccus endophyticus]|uniref:Uncharacterized protein n=1 Tax=Phycicoccus endophyticus TaxID=1690220 RepID=A0A7G9R2G4_9MICO|nr:hypothetical protein [Phycicoccus endophyticus]NHI20827.1 hypothetical protein [Phycicoccus endophyticus]QNN49789.1 hypothetical protein H9L10_01445 [Phycicoccus endophyticus]GGL35166.1 hypothetical protein GCM10012283_16970 [Phycicoccus endophyticus]
MRTPGWARLALYGVVVALLLLILTRTLADLLPGHLGRTVSRNSEGFLILLVVAAWLDLVRPRLGASRLQWPLTLGAGVVLVGGGLLLRQAPWPSQVVTLNEALVGLGILVVYLQLPRPLSRWALVVPAVGVLFPVLAGRSALATDMAEALGAFVLVPLVVDAVDPALLRDGPPHRWRNIVSAVALLALILALHVVTPARPEGVVENVTYYVQRATEDFVAAAVLLVYYATRRRGQPAAGSAAA